MNKNYLPMVIPQKTGAEEFIEWAMANFRSCGKTELVTAHLEYIAELLASKKRIPIIRRIRRRSPHL